MSEELGVTAPLFWLRDFGATACERALAHVAQVREDEPLAPLRYGETARPERLSNPAGYARAWLVAHKRSAVSV